MKNNDNQCSIAKNWHINKTMFIDSPFPTQHPFKICNLTINNKTRTIMDNLGLILLVLGILTLYRNLQDINSFLRIFYLPCEFYSFKLILYILFNIKRMIKNSLLNIFYLLSSSIFLSSSSICPTISSLSKLFCNSSKSCSASS